MKRRTSNTASRATSEKGKRSSLRGASSNAEAKTLGPAQRRGSGADNAKNELVVSVERPARSTQQAGVDAPKSAEIERKSSPKRLNYVAKFTVRIVLAGDCGVGKSALLSRLRGDPVLLGHAPQPTIGAAFCRYRMKESDIDLKIVELSGHRSFHQKLCPATLSKKPDIVGLVYNVSDPSSLESMRTYWGPRSLNEKWVPEQTRIMLIGIVDDARPREVNIDAAKKTASGLARALKRKQVDFTEVESSKDGNVVDLFTTIGNGVALRMLTQVTGQLKKVNASALQTKAMLRKTGFSEEFTSRNKLEPLCGFMTDRSDDPELEELLDGEEDDEDDGAESASSTKRWVELRGDHLVAFASLKDVKNGALPACDIEIRPDTCRTRLLGGINIEVVVGSKRYVFKPPARTVAQHWLSAINGLLANAPMTVEDIQEPDIPHS
ncbi:PH domain-containing protein [Plasmodiophora brassicae]